MASRVPWRAVPGESNVWDHADETRLFAAFLAWGLVMIAARWRVLMLAASARHLAAGAPASSPLFVLPIILPIAIYQDVAALAAVAAAFEALLAVARNSSVRSKIVAFGWIVCALGAAYSALNAELYRHLQSPLTYRLLVLSDNLTEVYSIILNSLLTPETLTILLAPVAMAAFAYLLGKTMPDLLLRIRRRLISRWAAVGLVVYFALGHLWATRFVDYPVDNPEWKFIASLFEPRRPSIAASFPASDLDDFKSADRRVGDTARTNYARADARPRNVVLFVMESVGAKYLELYGAPYHDSQEMTRLSQHAATFTAAYASQPVSDAALSALLVSTYPCHFVGNLPRISPDFAVEGMPQVMGEHGYRAAFFGYNFSVGSNLTSFLRNHGAEVAGSGLSSCTETSGGCDRKILASVLDWIDEDKSRPFCVILWTSDSHYPYAPPSSQNYGVANPDLNRYLNSVHWNDELLGDLDSALASRGLDDDTLLVVIGDHGEAFGQHGDFTHNSSVYDEQVRVPLLFVNRRLFPRPLRIDTLAQEIDVPPTILDLIGLPRPAEWQGRSLFSSPALGRAYLYANRINFTFGLVENNLKYIFEPAVSRERIFDLARDPDERNDLSGDPRYRQWKLSSIGHLAAWTFYEPEHLLALAPELSDYRKDKIRSKIRTIVRGFERD